MTAHSELAHGRASRYNAGMNGDRREERSVMAEKRVGERHDLGREAIHTYFDNAYHISQIVNRPNWTVSALLPLAIFTD